MLKLKKLILFIYVACVSVNVTLSQKTTRVQFSAGTTEVDSKLGKGTRRLMDNVMFTHGGARMYCDSAYFYSDKNSLDAFGNIHINQGDTVHVYGDLLFYDGNTRIAKIKNNVRLIRRSTELKTRELEYDIANGVGFYTNHADIVDQDNQLESKNGYYYTKLDMLAFQKKVIVTNPKYKIFSDTLNYYTLPKTAHFFGPTQIISDSTTIYCERGWYNTETDIAQLNQHASVKNSHQTIKADSLYYEKITGYGRAVNNVVIADSGQNLILKGDQGIYYENSEYARITGKAQFIQVDSDNDSLYLHADTLLSQLDTGGMKILKAFYGVRIFKSNLQGKCDSLAYSFADSIIRLYNAPVLWSEENQLSAEYIEIQIKNQQVDKMFLDKSSFIVSSEDTSKFNQIKGKNMLCYFKENELYRIDINGNGQTVYYPKDKDGIIGANKTECSDLIITLRDGNVNTIMFLKMPEATMFPLESAPINELILKGFQWLDDIRPINKEDIFRK